jgi:hypothetical protein
MRNINNSYLDDEKREELIDWPKKVRLVLEHVRGLQIGSREKEASNRKSTNSDAIFLGWQTMLSGKIVALYNILIKNHPLYHSTVTEDTLRKQNLEVPQIPRAFNRKLEGSDPLQ